MLLFFSLALFIGAACAAPSVMREMSRVPLSEADKNQTLLDQSNKAIDKRLSLGVLDEAEALAQKNQAAKWLLKTPNPDDSENANNRAAAPWLIGLIMVCLALSLGLYALMGGRGRPDEPYDLRLKAWDHLRETQPEALSYPQMAVLMRRFAEKNANDPEFWSHMGEVDMRAQNQYDAIADYEQLTRLAPNSASAWTKLGTSLVLASQDAPGPQARAAFQRALSLDPKDMGARYFLGRIALSEARFDEALIHFDIMAQEVRADDPRKPVIEDQIKATKEAQRLDAQQKAQTKTRILAMVNGLEAKLKLNPDSVEGWARLLRSYTILNDTKAYGRAEAAMRAQFAKSPQTIAEIMRLKDAPVGQSGAIDSEKGA